MKNTLRREKRWRGGDCKARSWASTRSATAQNQLFRPLQIEKSTSRSSGDLSLGTSPEKLVTTLELLLLNLKSIHLVYRSPLQFQWVSERETLLCEINWRKSSWTEDPTSETFSMSMEFRSCQSLLSPNPKRSEEHTSELQSRGHLVC